MQKFPSLYALFLLLFAAWAYADPAIIAVASNFSKTAAALTEKFERDSGHSVRLVFGSSGRLYAQIVNGAPFDVLLSADSERPRRLEESDVGVAGTRFTYAIGQLVLWSRDPQLRRSDCLDALIEGSTGKIALANPKLAPYGAATKDFLSMHGLWEKLQSRLVFGENAAQALQFVASGNASMGFIAKAHLQYLTDTRTSCEYVLPPSTHKAIEQQALLLSRATQNKAAHEFAGFLRSAEGRKIIEEHGYALPAVGE